MKKHDEELDVVTITMESRIRKLAKIEGAKDDLNFSRFVRYCVKKELESRGIINERS